MNEHVWLRDDSENVYYCEITSIRNFTNEVIEYTVKSIVGDVICFRTIIDRDLNIPVTCIIYLFNSTWIFGKVCYDFDKLIDDEECGIMEI